MSSNLPMLYSRRGDGRVQVWSVEVRGDEYRTSSGIIGMAMVTSAWTKAESKNIGRSNATTGEQQALSEATARWTKRREAEWRESAGELKDLVFFECMLAKKYEDLRGKLFTPAIPYVYSQPKLDGIRLTESPTGSWSRTGKPLVSTPHIHEEVDEFRLIINEPDHQLDGEIYADKLADDFNQIVSLAKKSKPDLFDLAESRRLLRYHIYDIPSLGHLPFGERWARLTEMFAKYSVERVPIQDALVLVDTVKVTSQEQLDALMDQYLQQGYEGQMIRLDQPYENKRSKHLLKRKEFQDQEFVIHAVHEGIGNRAGQAGRIECKTEAGLIFGTDPLGDTAHRRRLLKLADKLVGRPATVKFFRFTPGGVPRFGKLKSIEGLEDL